MKKRKIIIAGVCAIFLLFSCVTKNCMDTYSSATPKKMCISTIQGIHHRSDYEGKDVEKITGVVTTLYKTRYNKGFFMQSQKADRDCRTSEGIYVENKADVKVKVGDLVSVAGTVKELQFSKPNKNELTITSIVANKIDLVKNGLTVKPVAIPAKRIPKAIHTGDINDKLDIKKNAMDFYESYEGMLVSISDPVIVGAKEKYGDIAVVADGGKYAKNRTNNGGVKYSYDNEQSQKIIVSERIIPIKTRKGKFKDSNFTPNPGDKFDGNIVGVVAFDYNNYKVYNTQPFPKIIDCGAKVDSPKFSPNPKALSVATYNIENFTIADGPERVKALAIQIKNKLQTPDIIGLVEVADDDGSKKGSKLLSDDKTLQAIVDGIKKETGVEYKYLSVDPEHGKDGGWIAMHIRNAILYRTDRIKLPYFKQGNAKEDLDIAKQNFNFNPGRIGNNQDFFKRGRKPLVAHLKGFNKDIFVIVNHLKSKRGDDALYSAIRPVKRKTEEQRSLQADYVSRFMERLHLKHPQALIICMGDMNDFEFAPSMKVLKGGLMVNTVELLPENERHTYVYNGNSQVLDALLINREYAEGVKVDILNINSEFTKSQGAISDHDPILVQIQMR